MATIRWLIDRMRTNRRYWQFPLALAVLSGGSVPLSAWLMEATLPAWLFAVLTVLVIASGALAAWWLLLTAEQRRETS